MSNNVILSIALFDPEGTLVSLLDSKEIEYQYRTRHPNIKVAMDETIDVVGSNTNNPQTISILASILLDWLKANKFRKIQAQMNDGSIIYLQGRDKDEVIKILEDSIKVTAFDPEYNNLVIKTREE